MVRALAQQLRPLLVQLNSFASGQAFAQYAVPAVAVPQSGGLFGSKRVTTPLTEPLPGVNLPNVAAPKAPELKVGRICAVYLQQWQDGGRGAVPSQYSSLLMIAVRVGVVWVWAVERGRVVPGLV